ncbi:N-acetylmuramoyl-L-alanine amidase [Chryseobacterium sp. Ch-15]|uniref:N-acetylmuramoyl-L-alanine amidase n=1 Tax=Chryseobacterium muglaense TaxID=2893752 RepID=A0A9Q3UUJ2_9FLAO|nr:MULTISPECIES: N-acetylmuramoyl-L-alanine amidase [Chryseobacterium]MBD3903772.1 N-acetylmuramoyl-L-alanine amidase [Chryseobacterium muglaense]MBO6184592.1 N-acetylmuramoyl-L-alanine amidase [Chryseobacterium sp.]MCC9034847.1 N-acetylmuramoyl-L-alanine amidase [Chryseobacterium muglaense]MCM2553112.1 N-acetylmuramoyl-L-alanine amidase [Chryseobacterium muglaense]
MYQLNFKTILAFLLIFFTSFAFAQKKFTVVLDAGHGGSDTGANRNYSDIGLVQEKNVTLGIVLKLGAMLEKNKEFKVIYTRKIDEYPSLTDRTNTANRSKADLFISVHVNSSPSRSATARGTETFVQGPAQNRENLEVAKQENSVIYLDEKDKETFASYDASSPESLIALKLQQSKYLENSLIVGSFVEGNFEKSGRFSRGVKQENLHILRRSAMPSILIETGFVNNYEDAAFLNSEKGQEETAENIYKAIIDYKKAVDRKGGVQIATKKPEPVKPAEVALKNDFRILLMTMPVKYNDGDPELKGLNYILTIKENGLYKYYYSVTNMASVKDINLKTAKDAGFRNSYAVGFMPNQKLSIGYYNIEVYVGKDKLSSNSFILQTLKDVERNKSNGMFYYTYGKVYTLEDAVKLQKELEDKGIKNTVIQKNFK